MRVFLPVPVRVHARSLLSCNGEVLLMGAKRFQQAARGMWHEDGCRSYLHPPVDEYTNEELMEFLLTQHEKALYLDDMENIGM